MTQEKKARYVRYQVTIRNQYLNITDIHGRDFELPREIIREAEFIVGYEELEGVVLKNRYGELLALDTEKTGADRPVELKHDVVLPDTIREATAEEMRAIAVRLGVSLEDVDGE